MTTEVIILLQLSFLAFGIILLPFSFITYKQGNTEGAVALSYTAAAACFNAAIIWLLAEVIT